MPPGTRGETAEGQHRLRRPGGRGLSLGRNGGQAAGSETEEPHPPQGQARQTADRAGEAQQPDQIQRKGLGGTRLWRTDQRRGRDDGTHDRHRTRQSQDRDEEHRLQHAPPRCVAPHKSLPGVNTRQAEQDARLNNQITKGVEQRVSGSTGSPAPQTTAQKTQNRSKIEVP